MGERRKKITERMPIFERPEDIVKKYRGLRNSPGLAPEDVEAFERRGTLQRYSELIKQSSEKIPIKGVRPDSSAIAEGVKSPQDDAFKAVDNAVDIITHVSDDDENMNPTPEADWDNYKSILEDALDRGDLAEVLNKVYDMQTDANIEKSDMPEDFYYFQERVYKSTFGEIVFSLARKDYEGAGTLLDKLLDHQPVSQTLNPSNLLVLMDLYNRERAYDKKAVDTIHKKTLQRQLKDAEQMRLNLGDEDIMPSEINGQRVLDLYGDEE